MKKLFYVSCMALMVACGSAPQKEVKKTFVAEGNPLITDKFTADPAPISGWIPLWRVLPKLRC